MRYGGQTYFFRPGAAYGARPAARAANRGGSSGASSASQSLYSKFTSEARQAPASNDTCYVFPWNETKECYDVATHFDKFKADGRIDEFMINDLFRDIHTMRLWAPKMGDPLIGFAIVLFLISIPMFFGYLFSGLFTNYYKYEIKQDGDKRYIEKVAVTTRLIEIPMVSVMITVIGLVTGLILANLATTRGNNRIKRRAFVLKKIIEKHQRTTFEASGCTVTTSELGAYIKITLNWKITQPANPAPVVAPGPQPAAAGPARLGAVVPVSNNLAPAVQTGTAVSQVPFDIIEIRNAQNQPEKTEVPKTPLITEHPEDVRLQIPEEQPL